MAAKVKISHKELKGPDKFAQFIDNSTKYISGHYRKFLYFISGLIAIILILVAFFNYRNSQLTAANSIYQEAVDLNTQKEFDKAIDKFLLLQKQYPGQDISKISYYYLSSIYYEQGNFDKSLEYANQFLTKRINEPNLIDAAYMIITLDYFNKQEWQLAIDNASKIQNMESPYYHDINFIKGLSLEKLGKNEEAAVIYKDILSQTYPNQFTDPNN